LNLLPNVIAELEQHQKANPGTFWVFEGPRFPFWTLAPLGSKHIKTALKGTDVDWHGFHAFRRGLGARLYNNGTPVEKSETVAKILRHGSRSEATLKHYVEIEEETKATALQSLPRKIRKAK
jgi:integrase